MPRRRGALFWAGGLGAVVLVAAGTVVGYRGYTATTGPDGAVRGYFAALARGDAAQALAYGDVPAGPRTLLTATALAEQHRVAAITQLTVRATTVHGPQAQVRVAYRLDFPGRAHPVAATIALHRRGGTWRLDRVAVATRLRLTRAAERAAVLGTRVSGATVLLFPGAVPVRLDTPYLKLSPAQAGVAFGAGPVTDVDVVVSDAGRRQGAALVAAALRACLTGRGPQTCPLPAGRIVPGSLRGRLVSNHPALTVGVDDSPTGVLDVTGAVGVDAAYRQLSFQNRTTTGRGRLLLPVHARAYAVDPLRFRWALP